MAKATTEEVLRALGACETDEYTGEWGQNFKRAFAKAKKAGYYRLQWLREQLGIAAQRYKICPACKGEGQIPAGKDHLTWERVQKLIKRKYGLDV